MAYINPADKARFGEDATPEALKNAERAGLRAGPNELMMGNFYARYAGGHVETSYGRYSADPQQWEILKALIISHAATYRRPPAPEELRDMLFAAGVIIEGT